MTDREMKSMLEIVEKVNELTNICHGLKAENERLKNENDFLRDLIGKMRS